MSARHQLTGWHWLTKSLANVAGMAWLFGGDMAQPASIRVLIVRIQDKMPKNAISKVVVSVRRRRLSRRGVRSRADGPAPEPKKMAGEYARTIASLSSALAVTVS